MSVCYAASVLSDPATPWTEARQALLSVGFSRQEYWSGLPFPPPGDLLNSGIEPASLAAPALQVDSLLPVQPGKPRRVESCLYFQKRLNFASSSRGVTVMVPRLKEGCEVLAPVAGSSCQGPWWWQEE